MLLTLVTATRATDPRAPLDQDLITELELTDNVHLLPVRSCD